MWSRLDLLRCLVGVIDRGPGVPAILFALYFTQPVFAAEPGAAPEDALAPLKALGCTACHSTDGTAKVGPSFLGLVGQEVVAIEPGGARKKRTVDEAYLRQSIRSPSALTREGYPPHTMPNYSLSEAQVDGLVAALHSLSSAEQVKERRRTEGPLWPLLLATLLFVGGHLLLASGPIRSPLCARFGEPIFQGGYSLFVGAAMSWMIMAWAEAPYIPLWPVVGWMPFIPMLIMPFAFILFVAGMTIKNATTAGQTDVLTLPEPARGVARITRHPVNCSMGLWAVAHLPVNGDVAALIFFGGFALLAVMGTSHIEARRRRDFGEDWQRLCAVTSVVPFVAVLQGRNRLDLKEIGWLRVLGGLFFFFATLLWSHRVLIGASPLPW